MTFVDLKFMQTNTMLNEHINSHIHTQVPDISNTKPSMLLLQSWIKDPKV